MEKYIYHFLLLDNIKKETCFNNLYNQNIEIILNKIRKRIKKYTKNNCQIVVAKYNENLKWLDNYKHLATIYDKSDNPIDGSIKLVNVGRETHTYLYHIIKNWDNLSENTFFTQGNLSEDHKPYPLETYLLKKKKILFFSHFFCKNIKFRNNSKYLSFDGKWKRDFDNYSMKRSHLSFEDFWKMINDQLIDDYSNFKWSHGGIFSVNRKLIKSKPIEYYINLIKYVSHHINPEEGHYFERCWYYIFFSQRYNYLLNNYFFFLDNIFYNGEELNKIFLKDIIKLNENQNNQSDIDELNHDKIKQLKSNNKDDSSKEVKNNKQDNKNNLSVNKSITALISNNISNNKEIISFSKISILNKDYFNYDDIINNYLNQ